MKLVKQTFSAKRLIQSFGYAINGIRFLLKNEHNIRIHFIAALCVIALGFLSNLDFSEWLWISIAIGQVFVAEIFNTAFEKTLDLIKPEYDEKVKTIKDLSAAAVLIISMGSIIMALLLFIPKFI